MPGSCRGGYRTELPPGARAGRPASVPCS